MNSQFHNLSLRGKTGILFGIFSLIFIYFIQYFIGEFSNVSGVFSVLPISIVEIILVGFSVLFVLISYLLLVFINKKRRKRYHLTGWEASSKKIRVTYFIFLLIGGILLYFYLQNGYIKYILPTSMLLYGLSSIVVNKFTIGKSNFLGISFLISAVISFLFPNFQFQIWALSFGAYHIIYGVVYLK